MEGLRARSDTCEGLGTRKTVGRREKARRGGWEERWVRGMEEESTERRRRKE